MSVVLSAVNIVGFGSRFSLSLMNFYYPSSEIISSLFPINNIVLVFIPKYIDRVEIRSSTLYLLKLHNITDAYQFEFDLMR